MFRTRNYSQIGMSMSMKMTSNAISPIVHLIASSPFWTTTQMHPSRTRMVSRILELIGSADIDQTGYVVSISDGAQIYWDGDLLSHTHYPRRSGSRPSSPVPALRRVLLARCHSTGPCSEVAEVDAGCPGELEGAKPCLRRAKTQRTPV